MFIKPSCSSVQSPHPDTPYYYDEFGNKYHDLIRRVSMNPNTNTGRLKKISIMYNEDNKSYPNIYKESAIGYIEKLKNKNVIRFDNYAYTVTDINNGKYIQSGGFSNCPSEINDCDPCVYYGFMNQLVPSHVNIDDDSYKKIFVPSLENLEFTSFMIDSEVCQYENTYQLPYTETLGLLNSFFSTWTYAYPFECAICIDTKRKCFNVPKIVYLPYIAKDDIRCIYINFIHEVNTICHYLSSIMEKEKRIFNIIVFLHPFGSVIRLNDKKYCQNESFYNHHSTQVQSIMKNVKTEGLRYIRSEGLGLLKSSTLNTPVDQALECCDILY
jgi:hypothetical protein